ncbi:hypothetical protein ANOM_000227 [Aspergillus nomiae NRRL 13137]|uniref:BZIP domain-containing protein n=1 Tax=Aspergillus nomiae NRRL (strain ATCC 15546 / NRRL 13137 / CBS 260.88 / M93) TaxID=1509407 RepID=A0A0L1JJN3_ASPN3|nr:uncharacterized protein ANOM_000227 [Aspergillus nomiae NRRL 13137]KNG91633.1 hypothetical protein ANOM_000227 [Aspergillus nomiae NRRL 13137]
MSSSRSVSRAGLNSLPGKSGEDEGCSSTSDGLRRLRTGKRGRPPIDPTQKGLVERRRKQVRKAQRTYRSRKEEEDALRMNYVQVLESRIRHMKQSFFEMLPHVTKAESSLTQPDLTHELQSITRDFLSASQIVEPFNESRRDDGHVHHSNSSSDPNPSGPVCFPNIYTSCATEFPLPAAVPIETPTPILTLPLGLPSTFYEMEVPLPKNFAQRLYFSCIKRAHGLLTNPCADGAEVARVFQYSFHYSDANTMIATFDILLRTNADYQTAYVYGLGGAGTHYKNRPTDFGIVQNVPEIPSKANDETWFDPRDIEGWLEENGLVIGGVQSFMYLSEVSSFKSCRDMTLCQGVEPSLSSQRRSAKILNVDRFLNELLSRGVCLGCAPGFRRLDVEAAFSLAISDDPTFNCEL